MTTSHWSYEQNYEFQREFDIKVDILEFEGRMHSDEFIDWLHMVEQIFEYKDIPVHHNVKIVVIKLKKNTSIWWEHLKKQRACEGKNQIVTWEKMWKLLKNKFLPHNYNKKIFFLSFIILSKMIYLLRLHYWIGVSDVAVWCSKAQEANYNPLFWWVTY